MTMDFVQKFDIELDKEIYYAGEVVTGRVIVVTTENIKVKGNILMEIGRLKCLILFILMHTL